MRILALCLTLLFTGAAAANDFWHSEAPAVLNADQAFALMPAELEGGRLRVQWEVAPGYYLYRGRIRIEALEPAGADLGAVKLRAGEKIHDEHFGDVEIYRSGMLNADFHPAKTVRKLKIGYQGCAEAGICLPPQTRIVDVEVIKAP